MKASLHILRFAAVCALCAFPPSRAIAGNEKAAIEPAAAGNMVSIPRLQQAPRLEDFLTMRPEGPVASAMTRVSGFTQREPYDGQPVSERTEAYLGYDAKNIYAVFVCFDSDPSAVRARLSRREDVFQDDIVQLMVDTFNDQRRSYSFIVNPLGIQWDGIWTEQNGSFDGNFDTLWYSRGQTTAQGYVVWIAVPFRSLRFSPGAAQTWGLMLNRDIRRKNEETFWPAYSRKVQGRLNQAAKLNGLQDISPGRNMQFIPYGVFSSFRSLDTRDPAQPRFRTKAADGNAGLDSKFVIKDSFVLDTTIHPDFSQVESDSPQVTVNQRFEVFFPEKRPFFLENATYFETPINLVFTRRIADPQYGIRLTGKQGPYSVGALFADDTAPGQIVVPGDPLDGKRAHFGVGRVSREIGKQSSAGLLYTHREFQGERNEVAAFDTRIKLSPVWIAQAQLAYSIDRDLDGLTQKGHAVESLLSRDGDLVDIDFRYGETAENFRTATGFFRRPDIRRAVAFTDLHFKSSAAPLLWWEPNVEFFGLWDQNNTNLEKGIYTGFEFSFKRQTFMQLGVYGGTETLRPKDFSTLAANEQFTNLSLESFFETTPVRHISFYLNHQFGKAINFVPPEGVAPSQGLRNFGDAGVTLRPVDNLQITNSYLWTRLRSAGDEGGVLNNHILRTRWNYQITRELSLRTIVQYDSLLANPLRTSLRDSKGLNADLLVTYFLHPGTAFYAGYNSNHANIDRRLIPISDGLLRTRNSFLNDAQQFFVKASYLFRF